MHVCAYVVCSCMYQWGCYTAICLSVIDSWQAFVNIGNSSVTLSTPSLSASVFWISLVCWGLCGVSEIVDPVLPQQFSGQQFLLCKKVERLKKRGSGRTVEQRVNEKILSLPEK